MTQIVNFLPNLFWFLFRKEDIEEIDKKTEIIEKEVEEIGKEVKEIDKKTEEIGNQAEQIREKAQKIVNKAKEIAKKVDEISTQTEEIVKKTREIGFIALDYGNKAEEIGKKVQEIGKKVEEISKKSIEIGTIAEEEVKKRLKIVVERKDKSSGYTIGKMSLNGIYFCDTLENTDRGLTQSMPENEINKIKIKGETAIPTGTYTVDMNTISPKYFSYEVYQFCGAKLPRLMNVPGYEGVLIHIGNYAGFETFLKSVIFANGKDKLNVKEYINVI